MTTSRCGVRRSLALVALGVLAAAPALSACGRSGSVAPSSSASGSSPQTPAASAPLWAAPGAAALPTTKASALQAALDSWVDAGHLKGVSAAVVTAAGTWAGAAGVDGTHAKVQPTSAMSMASITKTFVASEVVLLSSRGLVSLDAPLAQYVSIPFDAHGATVRQALSMRTGFPEFFGPAYRTAVAADLDRDWTTSDILSLIPAGAPGTGTLGGAPSYNNTNYVLLGELIAKVTGLPMGQALHRDLIDPAGLTRTWVQTADEPVAPLAVGTNLTDATIVDPAGPFLPSRAAASSEGGCGEMAASAGDVARWGYLLYGGHVIDSALVKQMEADPQPEPNIGPYALGTTVMTTDTGATMVGHGGGGLQWPYTSVMMVSTAEPVVSVAVMTPAPADFGTQVYDLFMQLQQIAMI